MRDKATELWDALVDAKGDYMTDDEDVCSIPERLAAQSHGELLAALEAAHAFACQMDDMQTHDDAGQCAWCAQEANLHAALAHERARLEEALK